jgi:uncharacterized membrane protein (UPF0127 family)
VIALLVLACGTHKLDGKLDTVTIQVDGRPMVVEVANTAEERSKGLMHRESLGAEEGMLFVYPSEEPRSFWMKDTRIRLSIAYADRTGRIVKIADMTPYSESRVQSLYPAQYALEVNQGWFAAHGVATGDMLTELPPVESILWMTPAE